MSMPRWKREFEDIDGVEEVAYIAKNEREWGAVVSGRNDLESVWQIVFPPSFPRHPPAIYAISLPDYARNHPMIVTVNGQRMVCSPPVGNAWQENESNPMHVVISEIKKVLK